MQDARYRLPPTREARAWRSASLPTAATTTTATLSMTPWLVHILLLIINLSFLALNGLGPWPTNSWTASMDQHGPAGPIIDGPAHHHVQFAPRINNPDSSDRRHGTGSHLAPSNTSWDALAASETPAIRPRLGPYNATWEIAVTLLYHYQEQSWKGHQQPRPHQTAPLEEDGEWLLAPQVREIPVTVFCPDTLMTGTSSTSQGSRKAEYHSRPGQSPGGDASFDTEQAWSHLLSEPSGDPRPGRVAFRPIVNGRRAQEVPGYVTYILDHYHDLPDVVIFLHARPHAHAANLLHRIQHVMQHWSPDQIGFLHLNDRLLCRDVGHHHDHGLSWTLLFHAGLGFLRPAHPTLVAVPCCAQFMVTRERIQLRPLWFYQRLLQYAYEHEDGSFPEHYWHVFFGEPALLPLERMAKTYDESNWTLNAPVAHLNRPYLSWPVTETMQPWYDLYQHDHDAYHPSVGYNRALCPPGSIP